MSNSFFRHFRPEYFDRKTMAMKPAAYGGISFLFHPREQGIYDYWIYVCPTDAKFSATAAVTRLNTLIDGSIKPWGTINKTDEPILSTAIRSIISEEDELPTTVSHLALKFVMTNLQEQTKRSAALQKARDIAAPAYEES
jgi:hypothetical protein